MSESERRFQRFLLPPGAVKEQRLKVDGVIGSIRGWAQCQIKDLSIAGALVYCDTGMKLGDGVKLKLEMNSGDLMVFTGEVVNLGRDQSTAKQRVGIRLSNPEAGATESLFLEDLGKHFEESK